MTKETQTFNAIPAGILSDAATKEINQTLNNTVKNVRATQSVNKDGLTAALKHITEVLVADIDGADGKFDGKISKETLTKKLNKIEEIDGIGKLLNGEMAQVLVQSHAQIKKMPDQIDAAGVKKSFNSAITHQVDKLASVFDKNHDGNITRREYNEVSEMLTTPFKNVSKAVNMMR